MKELSAQLVKRNIETGYQNEKIYGQAKNAFVRYGLPPKSYSYETTKSIKMPRAEMSKINANPLPFMPKKNICSSHKMTKISCSACIE
ncbi:hypothetical protein T07_13702 [Trichinella nelsoni]|uniref:Uncharacterized protein n=1 Tax=Trichinella nelsoni TaxID=6336 RepID=A0A0V0RCR0_9BILA|nr:hypothetical protein T07_13702 [Trichinella nelsoni]